MSDRIGYVVAIRKPDGQYEDLSSIILHFDEADACWERDLRNDEADEAGRTERFVVCEIRPVPADAEAAVAAQLEDSHVDS